MQCAHVMAMAVQKIFPDAKVTIGPWIENGFYYDFDMEPLTDRDLKKIKKEMVSSFIFSFFHFELQRHYKLWGNYSSVYVFRVQNLFLYILCRIELLVKIYHL